MNVAVIDAEIVGKTRHRFPNLCSMKISAYHKKRGDSVTLKTDYNELDKFDKVYISKVFVKTTVPGEPSEGEKTEDNIIQWYSNNLFLKMPNIEYGGTGFFYDKAPPLPEEIEHTMPDYHLYDDWVETAIKQCAKREEFKYYLDYSIGYLTRRCFRQCYYCVNRNYKSVITASPLSEFMDKTRPKLCFLDDNFFGSPYWKDLIKQVVESKKRFQFKQGLDERLLTTEKIIELSKWRYDGDVIFAFDNIEDKALIISKLKLIRGTVPEWNRPLKFYVFCGCDKHDKYDLAFWKRDIENLFDRISVLTSFGAKPYIMRFERVYHSEFNGFYSAVASWCNQPSLFRTMSFRLFCKCKGMRMNGYNIYKRDVDGYLNNIGLKGSTWLAMEWVEHLFPDIAEQYFDMDGKKKEGIVGTNYTQE